MVEVPEQVAVGVARLWQVMADSEVLSDGAVWVSVMDTPVRLVVPVLVATNL